MAKDTVTLRLSGNVTLRDYSVAISSLSSLMLNLASEVAKKKSVDWQIEGLDAGSAVATIRGTGDHVAVEAVVAAYEQVGKKLQSGDPLDFGAKVSQHAHSIIGLLDGNITSVIFETGECESEIVVGPPKGSADDLKNELWGSVRGRVQSLSSRKVLRFTLYEYNTDAPISCYLTPGHEDIMREAWGKIVIVEGWIHRSSHTNNPISVRQISGIQMVKDGHAGDYRKAIGCAPAIDGSISPEEAVRRIRDV